jgi:hypothetical protein
MGWKDHPLVTDKRKCESDPIVSTATPDSPEKFAAPMIDIRPGLAIPALIPPSAIPYSAGRYPNSRIYTVGDEITCRTSDLLTGVEKRILTRRVTRVDYDEDHVEFNDGLIVTDLLGNNIKSPAIVFAAQRQWNDRGITINCTT